MTGAGYSSRYSRHFQEQLLALPGKVYDRVSHTISLLEVMPGLGRPYEPEYEADLPPVSCQYMHVSNTTKCLYFTVDEEEKALSFFHLGDARQDPRMMFVGVHSPN